MLMTMMMLIMTRFTSEDTAFGFSEETSLSCCGRASKRCCRKVATRPKVVAMGRVLFCALYDLFARTNQSARAASVLFRVRMLVWCMGVVDGLEWLDDASGLNGV